jgi:multidrug efflux pump subunit AcrA (membrane-fusion protein)
LVTSQTEFLKTLGEVDVEKLELDRLQKVGAGAIPPNVILERKYTVQKLESRLAADREALKLHGLNDQQVQSIETDRKLLRTLEIFAPSLEGTADSEFRLTDARLQPVSYQPTDVADALPTAADDAPDQPAPLANARRMILEELKVHQGQALNAGEPLCVLADYSRLYIEGQAFERDSPAIVAARERGWHVTAEFEGDSAASQLHDLPIAYVANAVDVEARTLHFYVDLPNHMLPPPPGTEDSPFITWKYRPGQRLELAVPVEEWVDQLVLPVEAVAQEGAEAYVFLQNGKRFDRKSVHVRHRDQHSVVIANDGSLFPSDVVALRGAHQLQMALKNKSGGGVDPHAGHTH